MTIFGRFRGDASQLSLRVEATDAAGRPWSRTLTACPRPAASLLNLWGRVKVRELEDRYAAGSASDPQALAKQIVQVSLESRVLSRFTAYVAVDRSEVVNQGGKQQKILQPVEIPAGWEAGRAASLMCCLSAPAAPLMAAVPSGHDVLAACDGESGSAPAGWCNAFARFALERPPRSAAASRRPPFANGR